MSKIFALLFLLVSSGAIAQSSMRRCTLLPITDSVGGAIGYKVFEDVEKDLKRSNWCTYVSNSGLISIFGRYRENLPQHLKTKEVLATVANKLKVGSLVRVGIISEVSGVEVQMEVYGDNGEDLYFSEKTILQSDDIDVISSTVQNWLDTYSKTIPYDASVTGILGDQITLDVGKGYPIQIGQKFVVKRLVAKKKHPLLRKVVDWETKLLAEGSVFNISDNQALGMIRVYKDDQKLAVGNWVRLVAPSLDEKTIDEDVLKTENEKPGTLGLLSLGILGSKTSLESRSRWVGWTYGLDLRAEVWVTRQYFASLEILRSLGAIKTASVNREKTKPSLTYSELKFTGGYKYLPIGFFYGPQIDIYGGYAKKTYDVGISPNDGLGQATFLGLLLGVAASIPISREFKIYTKGEFLPFPSFVDEDRVYASAKTVSSLEFEFGVRYQYTLRSTLDFGFLSRSNKAKFDTGNREVFYTDNILKMGTTINF